MAVKIKFKNAKKDEIIEDYVNIIESFQYGEALPSYLEKYSSEIRSGLDKGNNLRLIAKHIYSIINNRENGFVDPKKSPEENCYDILRDYDESIISVDRVADGTLDESHPTWYQPDTFLNTVMIAQNENGSIPQDENKVLRDVVSHGENIEASIRMAHERLDYLKKNMTDNQRGDVMFVDKIRKMSQSIEIMKGMREFSPYAEIGNRLRKIQNLKDQRAQCVSSSDREKFSSQIENLEIELNDYMQEDHDFDPEIAEEYKKDYIRNMQREREQQRAKSQQGKVQELGEE